MSTRRRVPVALRRVVAAVVAAYCVSAFGQEFVVRDIRVEGVQRTDPGTVFSYLPVRVGDRFDPERGTQAIRALHSSGLPGACGRRTQCPMFHDTTVAGAAHTAR